MPKNKPAVSKKTKRNARKGFAKPKHNTRPFTMQDYQALPKATAVSA